RRAHGRGSSSGSMGPARRAARGSEPPLTVSSCAHLTRFPFLAATSEHEGREHPGPRTLGPQPMAGARIRRAADMFYAHARISPIARGLGPPTLCTASDGNHGRAVAALAEALGCGCVVVLPADSAASRIDSIKGHGAIVELVDGSYDDAVAAARAAAHARGHW